MKPPANMTQIINKKRYSTATATLIAGDDYHDGRNYERNGTNSFLYKTKKGVYFLVYLTRWQGQRDYIAPLTVDEAYEAYERLSEKRVCVGDAFPGIEIVDA